MVSQGRPRHFLPNIRVCVNATCRLIVSLSSLAEGRNVGICGCCFSEECDVFLHNEARASVRLMSCRIGKGVDISSDNFIHVADRRWKRVEVRKWKPTLRQLSIYCSHLLRKGIK
eukprot:IDg8629t1